MFFLAKAANNFFLRKLESIPIILQKCMVRIAWEKKNTAKMMIIFRDLYLDGIALKRGVKMQMCAIDNITYIK